MVIAVVANKRSLYINVCANVCAYFHILFQIWFSIGSIVQCVYIHITQYNTLSFLIAPSSYYIHKYHTHYHQILLHWSLIWNTKRFMFSVFHIKIQYIYCHCTYQYHKKYLQINRGSKELEIPNDKKWYDSIQVSNLYFFVFLLLNIIELYGRCFSLNVASTIERTKRQPQWRKTISYRNLLHINMFP